MESDGIGRKGVGQETGTSAMSERGDTDESAMVSLSTGVSENAPKVSAAVRTAARLAYVTPRLSKPSYVTPHLSPQSSLIAEGDRSTVTLREARSERGLTAEDLAALSGISATTIFRIEHGKTTPRPYVIRQLSEVLERAPWDIAEFAAALRRVVRGSAT